MNPVGWDEMLAITAISGPRLFLSTPAQLTGKNDSSWDIHMRKNETGQVQAGYACSLRHKG